jgi:hypothetical protein
MPLTWKEHVEKATDASQKACGLYLGNAQKRLESTKARVKSDVLLGEKVADEILAWMEPASDESMLETTFETF